MQDTGEAVTAAQLPADDRTGTGYDWMETAAGHSLAEIPAEEEEIIAEETAPE